MRLGARRLPVKECRYHPGEVAVFFHALPFFHFDKQFLTLGSLLNISFTTLLYRSIESLSFIPPSIDNPPSHHLPQVFATGCCILYSSTFPLSSSFSSKTPSSTFSSSTYKYLLEPLDISIDVLFREYVHLTTRTQHSWRQIQIQLIGRWSSIYCDHQPIIEVLRKHMQPRKHRSINIWTTKYNHKHSRMCTNLCKCCPFIGEEIYVLWKQQTILTNSRLCFWHIWNS